MKDKMDEIKARMEARVKAEPGNPDAWRELAQVEILKTHWGRSDLF